jgi:flagellin
MSVINTNISSLTAQRNLSSSQASLSTSMQRLSSGLRINSAKDDAAGLAISERMSSQIRGTNQAARNANDGISLAQTAEGDLTQVSSNLQRIRELSVQSANATNTTSDRAALNLEATALKSEIQRVASNSSFNGVKLLDGSFTAQDFQVGANNTANDRITIASIATTQTAALGLNNVTTTSFAAAVTGADSAGITINGTALSAGATSAKAIVAKINTEITDVTATAGPNAVASTTAASTAIGAAAGGAASVVINGVTVNFTTTNSAAATATVATVKTAINSAITAANTAGTGGANAALMGLVVGGDTTHIDLSNTDGGDISTGAITGALATDIGMTASVAAVHAAVTFTSAAAPTINAGGVTILGGTQVNTAVAPAAGTGVASIDISTLAGAKLSIDTVDRALTEVNNSRASLGAIQNRFTSVVTSLQTTSENLSASRSRIQDADFAAETANLSRAQVLQQAGTAMVAQANQLPQGVLALLR